MLENFGTESDKVRCVFCKRWILKKNSEPIHVQDTELADVIGIWATIGFRCKDWSDCNKYHHLWDNVLC